MKFLSPDGLKIDLTYEQPIAAGGEGKIFPVRLRSNLVAKIFSQPRQATLTKLLVMLAAPRLLAERPELPMAWPVGLLYTNDRRREFAGYLMRRVVGARSILDVYHPKTRRLSSPSFDYRYLHRTARNLASAMALAHSHRYVLGDVNESNFLVADNGCVTVVDVDSWQVRDPATGILLRCNVGKPEFIPPELQGKLLPLVDRTEVHDRFGLGVLLFKLLMEGTHPFDGVWLGSGDPPALETRIARGYFPHGNRAVPMAPKPGAPPFNLMQPGLQSLFIQCFEEGHRDPTKRPDANTWAIALQESEEKLCECFANSQHWFGIHLTPCPWCERKTLLGGLDPFPPIYAAAIQPPLGPYPHPALASTPRPRRSTPKSATASATSGSSFGGFAILGLTLLAGACLLFGSGKSTKKDDPS